MICPFQFWCPSQNQLVDSALAPPDPSHSHRKGRSKNNFKPLTIETVNPVVESASSSTVPRTDNDQCFSEHVRINIKFRDYHFLPVMIISAIEFNLQYF